MSDLDVISEQNLLGVNPFVAAKAREAAATLATIDVWVRIVSGFRSAAAQTKLYAQGRTTPGKIVTNAIASKSMHNYGLAFDAVPFISGRTGALNWKAGTPQFQHMVAAFKAAGLDWGGDWLGDQGDFDHFQIRGLKPTPTPAMIADYGDGSVSNLQNIWNRVAQGAYSAARV
jgi:peptidoglycan L-alanyl-D-glutamate endopeptidase CwlK